MKLRTRLPRASTTASAATWTPDDQLHSDSVPKNESVISKEQCGQILQQLEAFDTEDVFTGALTTDGRLAADGPLVMYNLRYRNDAVSMILRHPAQWCLFWCSSELFLHVNYTSNFQAVFTQRRDFTRYVELLLSEVNIKCAPSVRQFAGGSWASVERPAKSITQDRKLR